MAAPAGAQQFNNWYFGRHAALSFTPSGATPVPRVLTNSQMDADEGTAAISDENGDLLFYTNGVTIYNKTHTVMLNGDNLQGNISSAQIMIAPMPGNDSIFYIFTTDALENDLANGYRYSIVNMRLDNGKGAVIVKNQLLWPECSERMALARHANGIDLWLITNDKNSNIFRSWLLSCTGLLTSPVTSTIGAVLDQYRDINAGILKVSPDGSTLCQTHFPFFDELTHPPNFVQLFDFDAGTGLLSNVRSISFSDAQYNHAEFSPNGRLLYLTRAFNTKIDQLNISLPSMAGILASRVTISPARGYFDIQMGPDEKLYLSQPGGSLGVIHQPNSPGFACDFRDNQLSLGGGNAFIGLPSHINDFVAADDPRNGYTYSILDSCAGKVQFTAYSNLAGTVSWEWDFGDGTQSNLQNPLHTFTPSTRAYTVRLKISSSVSCGTVLRSKLIKPGGYITVRPDFQFVVRCDSDYVRFKNTTPGIGANPAIQEWDFGDGNFSSATNPVHHYVNPGRYTVTLRTVTGLACLDSSRSYEVEVRDFTVNLPAEATVLVGQPVFLSTDQPAATYEWSPATWLSATTIRNPVARPLEDIVYHVKAANNEGCTGEDSIVVHVIQFRDIYVPNAFTPDNDGKNDVFRPFFSGQFRLREFAVYSRWGNRVFQSNARGAGWDGMVGGQPQATGMYTWRLVLEDKNGGLVEKKGTVMLIR